MNIQSQCAGETTGTDFAMDTSSPYIDTLAPLTADIPEERRFQVAYLDDDVITTGLSDTLVVIAHG